MDGVIQEFEFLWNAEFHNRTHQAFLMSITMTISTSLILINKINRNKYQLSCYLKHFVDIIKNFKIRLDHSLSSG